MTAVTNEHKLVKYNNNPSDPAKKKSCFDCCKPKIKARKKHSRQFTQHEIDYTIQRRAQDALKINKKVSQVFVEPWDFTDGKVIKNEDKS